MNLVAYVRPLHKILQHEFGDPFFGGREYHRAQLQASRSGRAVESKWFMRTQRSLQLEHQDDEAVVQSFDLFSDKTKEVRRWSRPLGCPGGRLGPSQFV